jgi:hypothetical protein
MPKMPWVDPGPLKAKAPPPAGPAVGDGSQGYDVVFTYKSGGEPGHHVFPTLAQAKAFAAEYSKGVYSTQDGTLTSINIVPLGNAGGKAGASAPSRPDVDPGRAVFDDAYKTLNGILTTDVKNIEKVQTVKEVKERVKKLRDYLNRNVSKVSEDDFKKGEQTDQGLQREATG